MKISGIYQIQSKADPSKIYIGSSVNIKSRWGAHISSLRSNSHINFFLQEYYNIHGESDLQFSILLGCNRSELIEVEKYFTSAIRPFFNIKNVIYNGNELRKRKGRLPIKSTTRIAFRISCLLNLKINKLLIDLKVSGAGITKAELLAELLELGCEMKRKELK